MKRRILTPSLKAKLAADRETKLVQSINYVTEFLVLTAPLAVPETEFKHCVQRPNWGMAPPHFQGGGEVVMLYKGLPIRFTLYAMTGPLLSNLAEQKVEVLASLLSPGTVEFQYVNGYITWQNDGKSAIALGVCKFVDVPAAARAIPIAILHKTKRD